ncbi:hypothetical protein KR222_003693 [Zaprionus bogoriensis]|nr:hypothetical protein KR222_003693 [Zaprionus bogoriensis]
MTLDLTLIAEGDPCTVKKDLPGVCQLSSKCEPHIDKYIKTGILTTQDVPSCGFGTLEEIVCCPIAECCPGDTRPRQVSAVTTARPSTTRSTSRAPSTTTSTTTTTTTTTERDPTTMSMLDRDSSFFDFQKLLNQPQPQAQPQSQPQPQRQLPGQPQQPKLINRPQSLRPQPRAEPRWPSRAEPEWGSRAEPGWGSRQEARPAPQWGSRQEPQSVMGWGSRPESRRNSGWGSRPGSGQGPARFPSTAMQGSASEDPNDLVRLVNERLRQQGMEIQPARQVNTFVPRTTTSTTTTSTTSTTTTTTTTTTISPLESDPWAPFRFREHPQDEIDANELGTGSAESFGFVTTSAGLSHTLCFSHTHTQPLKATHTHFQTPACVQHSFLSDLHSSSSFSCRIYENGLNEPALTPHILDGIPVNDGFYPHMAAIALSSIDTIAFRCGGSLISSRHVLTAAHCVNFDTPVFVRLGTVNIDKVNAFYQDINVTNIAIHPDYSSDSKYNDIAILELVEAAKFSLYIYPACLELDPGDPPEIAKLFVAGWGVMNQTSRSTSKILLRAPLDIVPLQQCNSSIAQLASSTRFLKDGVINTLLCAADRRRRKADACQGDSGGPLVLERDKENNKYSILGIISSGFGCATPTPGLYTRVASYLDFIEGVVWPNNVV